MYTIHYTLYTMHYTLYSILYTLCTMHYTLYSILYTLCTMHYTLYTISLVIYMYLNLAIVKMTSFVLLFTSQIEIWWVNCSYRTVCLD